MWLFENSGFVALIIFVINIIFMAGVYYGRIKNFITKSDVQEMMNRKIKEEVDKAITDHCPFVDKLKELDTEHIEHIIDRRVEVHPLIQKYRVTDHKINELVPEVKQIGRDIKKIEITLAKINGRQ
jgi:hypothetical protein